MFAEALLLATVQVGPFFQSGPDDFTALRPLWSEQAETTDVLWPLFTRHRDWWRCCWFIGRQHDLKSDAYQFHVLPLWWNGRTRAGKGRPAEDYWGFFPFYGHHPHWLLMYDWDFVCWPLWMRYKIPRGRDGAVEKNCVLWPIVSWRDDGSWGVWPLYGCAHQRESFHQYALWPLVTWAEYEPDRDTAGAGYSWMCWPLYGEVRRERERQTLVLPPLFSYAETYDARKSPDGALVESCPNFRLRCPWPLFELEHSSDRDRISVFPFYERETIKRYVDGSVSSKTVRYGWKLVELYPDETRVFPFWVSRDDGSYFRLWPFYEQMNLDRDGEVKWSGALALFPIRWVDSVDRNWASFWTLYESVETPVYTDHSLFWGLITWRTWND